MDSIASGYNVKGRGQAKFWGTKENPEDGMSSLDDPSMRGP